MIPYCAIKSFVGWYYAIAKYNVIPTDTILYTGTEEECWEYIKNINKGIIDLNGTHKSDNSEQPSMNFNYLNQRL